jgi:hypothetical protein
MIFLCWSVVFKGVILCDVMRLTKRGLWNFFCEFEAVDASGIVVGFF